MKISQRIGMFMGIKRWTIKDLSKRSRVNYTTIKRLLDGGDAYISTIEKLVKAFGCTMCEFYAISEPVIKKSLLGVRVDAPVIAQKAIQRISEKGARPK